ILNKKLVNGFCLVSSDSDYAGIANRIREEGVFVMGIGRANTPEAFQKACEIFIYTENLNPELQTKTKPKPKPRTKAAPKKTETLKSASDKEKIIEPELSPEIIPSAEIKSKITKTPLDISLVDKAFEMAVQDDDLAYLSGIGIHMRRLDPSFDPRTYGFSSLTGLFKSLTGQYELVYKSRGSPPFIKKKK
ncbi:MAG: NYN domain-containing protein, partial [Ignavibacteria bacterium]